MCSLVSINHPLMQHTSSITPLVCTTHATYHSIALSVSLLRILALNLLNYYCCADSVVSLSPSMKLVTVLHTSIIIALILN
jgi:hypothetical protein